MYLDWEKKAGLASQLYWYSSTALIHYLHDLKDYIYNTVEKNAETCPRIQKTLLPACKIS
jgi:hypothetical protein